MLGAGNVVSILVQLSGAHRVQQQMQQLNQNITKSSRQMSAGAGSSILELTTRVTTLGTAIGATSLYAMRGYAQFRQFEIAMESLVGRQLGLQLAKDVQQFGLATAYTTGEVQNMAQMMLAMGAPTDQLMSRMSAMADLVAAMGGGTEQFVRAGIQLSQIQSLGKVQYQDIRALSQSFPVQMIAKAAGVDNPMKLSGMEASKFFAAMEKAADSLGNVQERIVRENPLVRLQNLIEGVVVTLIPVGKGLNALLNPLFTIVEGIVGVTRKFAELKWGAATLAVVGIGALFVAIKALIRDLLVLRSALLVTAQAALANAKGQAAGAVAGASTAGAIGKGVIARLAPGFAAKIGARFAGSAAANVIPVVGQIASVGLAIWAIVDIIRAFSGAVSDVKSNPKKLPATQPTQRSDIENIQWRMATEY